MQRKILIALSSLVALVIVGLFLWPTAYIYMPDNDLKLVYRVNRFTGIKEVSSDYGWKTDKELQEILMAEYEREKADYAAKTAAFVSDAKNGKLKELYTTGAIVTVVYKDGHEESATAASMVEDHHGVRRALEKYGVPMRGQDALAYK